MLHLASQLSHSRTTGLRSLQALSYSVSLFLEGAIEHKSAKLVTVLNNSGLVLLPAGVPHSKHVICQCGRFIDRLF